ncbi:MAG: hypothetical protein LBF22_14495 [Deltaproteobacteria bacterium]|nr:hypothetical protein [Deltaproteobacteria bacterium]
MLNNEKSGKSRKSRKSGKSGKSGNLEGFIDWLAFRFGFGLAFGLDFWFVF